LQALKVLDDLIGMGLGIDRPVFFSYEPAWVDNEAVSFG